MAEMELNGGYHADESDAFFAHFTWENMSSEEWLLCPPVVAMGGDGAMFDIGFQNLSRALMTGMPIKVLIVDTQVYSNTGGQACTSGFISQVADMSPYGKDKHGKSEIRKEISLIGMAHRTSYIMQGAVSNPTHLIESYIDGLNSRRPALFNIYAVCPPEHGVGDDRMTAQSKLAVESRAFPLFRYNPDLGVKFSDCVSLEGNPAIDSDWQTYRIDYLDDAGNQQKLSLPMTFADFALTEGRFAKQFKKVPQEAWNDDMVLLSDFLQMGESEREGRIPFIWGVDKKQHLMRVLVSKELVLACEERLSFWHQLRDLTTKPQGAVLDEASIANRVREELLQRITQSLGAVGNFTLSESVAATPTAGASAPGIGGFEAVCIDTPECTACDECTNINPKIFAYNDQKKAIVVNPKGGTFLDIVKSAEKCTAGIIHPGTPWNMNEPNVEKLIQRAAKFN
jgi:pyruvate-ferredoxin/flavodoxin oxidoreductase